MLLTMATSKDTTCGRLVAQFDLECSYGVAARHVDSAVLCSGIAPSYAVIPMPLKNFGPGQWDEIAPTCALKRSGPAGAIPLRTPARIYAAIGSIEIPILNAYAVSHSHQIGEDSIITEAYDARWVLGKYTCKGRIVWDPSTNQVYWDLASECVYNAMGYPDCLDHPTLGPVHAPCHRFGFRNDFKSLTDDSTSEDFDEPVPGAAQARARSWRSQDAVRDQRNKFAAASGGIRPPLPVDIGESILPDSIIWPESLGTDFGTDRKLINFALEGNGQAMSLLQALQALARKAGAFDLYVDPNSDGTSTLAYVDMNPKSNTGCVLITAEYAASISVALNSPCVIKSGNVRESFIDGFDQVCEIGDAPAVEMMTSTIADTTFTYSLEPAWSAADETAFKSYIVQYGRTIFGVSQGTDPKGTSYAFDSACKRWPLVYCAYRIKSGFNPWTGTKWTGMQNGGRPRVKPFQLTGYQQDQTNPRNWQPREIQVEYYNRFSDNFDSNYPNSPGATDNQWYPATPYDNLTLSADGTMIFLSALRTAGQSWVSGQTFDPVSHTNNVSNGTYRGDTMVKRDIRIQLAICADWPLTSLQGKGGDKTNDPNRIYSRVAPTPKFCWQVTSPPMDYVEYLRRGDSRPIGEANLIAINNTTARTSFEAKCTVDHELFTDRFDNNRGRMADHALQRLKHVKRVDVFATLEIETMAPCHRPGNTISVEGTDTIPVFGVLKTVVLRSRPESDEQGQTSLIVEPPDSQAVYSAPSSAGRATSASSAGASPQAESPQTSPVSYPQESSTSSSSSSTAPSSSPSAPASSGYSDSGSTGAKSAGSYDTNSTESGYAGKPMLASEQGMGGAGGAAGAAGVAGGGAASAGAGKLGGKSVAQWNQEAAGRSDKQNAAWGDKKAQSKALDQKAAARPDAQNAAWADKKEKSKALDVAAQNRPDAQNAEYRRRMGLDKESVGAGGVAVRNGPSPKPPMPAKADPLNVPGLQNSASAPKHKAAEPEDE